MLLENKQNSVKYTRFKPGIESSRKHSLPKLVLEGNPLPKLPITVKGKQLQAPRTMSTTNTP